VRWVTFEDAHVAEYRDPPQIERATGDLTAMLLAGEIDAAIFGAELPPDARLESVIPQPEAAAQAWYRKHRVTPVNHLVVVKTALVRSNPQAVAEAYRLLAAAKQAAPAPAGIDPAPYGIAANRPAFELIVDYCLQQRMIPRRFSGDELFAEVGQLIGAE
jgi:4,5-dihydroxyphthalate decarboxylase